MRATCRRFETARSAATNQKGAQGTTHFAGQSSIGAALRADPKAATGRTHSKMFLIELAAWHRQRMSMLRASAVPTAQPGDALAVVRRMRDDAGKARHIVIQGDLDSLVFRFQNAMDVQEASWVGVFPR